MSKLRSLFLYLLIATVLIASSYLIYSNYIEDNLASRQPVQQSSSTSAGMGLTTETSTGTAAGGVKQADAEQQVETENKDNNEDLTDGTDVLQLTEPQPAYSFEVENISGKKVKLSDYKGKPVILYFWATWSPNCIGGMQELQKLGNNLEESKRAVLLTVNVGEDKKLVEEFVENKGLTLQVLLDLKEIIALKYGIQSYPVTVFINSDGTVYGYINQATDASTVLEIIDKMK